MDSFLIIRKKKERTEFPPPGREKGKKGLKRGRSLPSPLSKEGKSTKKGRKVLLF